jgi:predicted RNA-binding protein with TRAM domain
MFDDLFNVGLNTGASQSMDVQQAEELVKTLQIGHANGLNAPGSLVGGAALVAESLDSTLKSVTYDATNLVFWPSIAQDRAYSLTEQYVRTNSYGDGGSPYIPESGSPAMNDSEYNRQNAKVVFFSTRRGVSLASTLVRQALGADPETRESQSGTLWMLERMERELYKGLAEFSNAGLFDGSNQAIPLKLQNLNLTGAEVLIRQGDSDFTAQARAFDGYGATDTVIYDKLGDFMNETDFEFEANLLVENFGRPDQTHMSPRTMSDFIKQFYPKERVNALGMADGKAGYIVREMVTTAGGIQLRPNIFLKPKSQSKSQNDRAGVPNAPGDLRNNATASIVAGSGNVMDQAAFSNPNGQSNLSAGDIYVYRVTSCNEQGEGAAYLETVSVTISANGNQASFNIYDVSTNATHYAIYRTSSQGSGIREFVGYQKRSAGSISLYIDAGNRFQGSATAYMMDMRPEIMVWRQLAPLMKINLAPITTAKEFLLWLAGTIIIFAPRKSGIFQNIGKA